jgi:hypothetical protein
MAILIMAGWVALCFIVRKAEMASLMDERRRSRGRGALSSKLWKSVMYHEDVETKACRQSSYIDVSVKAMISWLMAQQ